MVSLSPATSLPVRRKSASSAAGGIGPALLTDPHVDLLVNGSFFTLYNPNGDKKTDIYIFYQAEDAGPGCLYYWDTASNSVAPGSLIPLGRVNDVIKGKRTAPLSNASTADAARCLAILFSDNGLHLEADSENVADGWVRGLAALISVKVGRAVTGDAPAPVGAIATTATIMTPSSPSPSPPAATVVTAAPVKSPSAPIGFTIHPSPPTNPALTTSPAKATAAAASSTVTPPRTTSPPPPPPPQASPSSANGTATASSGISSPTNGARGLAYPAGKHASLSKSMSLPKSQMAQQLGLAPSSPVPGSSNGNGSPGESPDGRRKQPTGPGGAVAINWNGQTPVPAPGPATVVAASPAPQPATRSPLPAAKR